LIDEDLIKSFKEQISNKEIFEQSASPLFLSALHEDDKVPTTTNRLIQQRIQKCFNGSDYKLKFTFPRNDQVRIQNDATDLSITMDLKEKIIYDCNRKGLRAKDCPPLQKISSAILPKLQSLLMGTFSSDQQYSNFGDYSDKIASVLLTKKGAPRQGVHCDTSDREGISALVAMNGAFKIIVIKNSVHMIRRIAQIRASWILSGAQTPPGIDKNDENEVEAWFDEACYAQLKSEGWGTGNLQLEAFTVSVPEGAAIVFSTWMLHCGHEYTPEDIQTFNRIHLYILPYDMGTDYNAINSHRTMAVRRELPFSSALHFLPRPVPPPQDIPLPRVFG
jgi:hypothetical protein